jgi:hypothetical protein
VQLVDLAIQRLDEQPHQCADLVTGPTPVLAAECKQGQGAYLALHAFADRHAHRLDALAMTGLARQSTGVGPATVAVHDDCDVARQRHWRAAGRGVRRLRPA